MAKVTALEGLGKVFNFDDVRGIERGMDNPSPLDQMYFHGDMVAKYEPLVDAVQKVCEMDGDDEDAWNTFEEHFEKFCDFSWCSNWDGMRYDIGFYGVSGYTGYLMMQYLKRVALKKNPEKFTMIFSGRSADKVQAVRDREFGGSEWEDTAVMACSYDDPVSCIDFAKSCRVIVNVAGPYMLARGEVLIDACTRTGTHYCDVSGELPWTLRTFELDKKAKEGGAIIIPSSAVAGGYPDLLVYMCAKKMREEYGEELRRAVAYCTGGGSGGGSSGGTLASRGAMSMASDDVRKKMADSFAMGGFIPEVDRWGVKNCSIEKGTGKVILKTRREDQDAILSKISEDTINGVWRAPFTYAFFDTRISRRSNALMADLFGTPYGKNFNFTEYSLVTPEMMQATTAAKSAAKAAGPSEAPASGSLIPNADAEKKALEEAGKYYKQGEGPPLEDLGDCWLAHLCWVETEGGNMTKCALIGGDGYFETARAAVEMAMTLRFDREHLGIKGGVLTATVAGRTWWAQRLIASGIQFFMGEWPPYTAFHPPEGAMGG